jgi:glyoxylase-like metal-dependent hydrolase (beta-lactamase superfamily II)
VDDKEQATLAFLTEPEPQRGVPQTVAEGVQRLVARNPSKMTYHGTNTYLIADGAEFYVLDPGPGTDPAHLDDIMDATEGRIHMILLSHGHTDHFGALSDLRARSGAPVAAYRTPMVPQITPDIPLDDGDRIGPFVALHTPGHAPDHLCFARDDGVLFSADHVMAWSSSVVSPPNGNMAAYVRSLSRLLERDDTLYLPGHGPALHSPRAYVEELRRRRVTREEEILVLVRKAPISTIALRAALYSKSDPVLQAAAERNVIAHLAKLQSEGLVSQDDELWSAV